MSEKRVVLVNRAVYLPGEGGYKRTMYLFDMMRRNGYHPILLTSDFNHYKKQARNTTTFFEQHKDYKDSVVFVHTPVYSKNISLKRYLAEKEWTKNVKTWFVNHSNEVGAVMLSMPDMNTILAIKEICKNNNIEMIIDVRDLRPEAFRVIVKNEALYKILLNPMKRKADRAYASADKLFAVSNEYLERGSEANKKAKLKKAVYIGAVINMFDAGVSEFASGIDKNSDEIWLTYAGTLGESYDLYTCIDALEIIQKEEKYNVRFMILGQGPEAEKLKQYVESNGISNVTFVGFVEYKKMAAYLSKSDITINAIKKRGSQSIINKVADYFAAGIPMLNGCVCKEQQDMVDKYSVGLNYEPENVESLVSALNKLLDNPALCHTYGKNARRLAEEKFDREHSYFDIINGIYND